MIKTLRIVVAETRPDILLDAAVVLTVVGYGAVKIAEWLLTGRVRRGNR